MGIRNQQQAPWNDAAHITGCRPEEGKQKRELPIMAGAHEGVGCYSTVRLLDSYVRLFGFGCNVESRSALLTFVKHLVTEAG